MISIKSTLQIQLYFLQKYLNLLLQMTDYSKIEMDLIKLQEKSIKPVIKNQQQQIVNPIHSKSAFLKYKQEIPTGTQQSNFQNNINIPNYYQNVYYPPNNLYLMNQFDHFYGTLTLYLNHQLNSLENLLQLNEKNISKTKKQIQNLHRVVLKQQSIENQVINRTYKIKGDQITSTDLINFIYDDINFKYRLVLDSTSPFQKLLYRQRNFRIKVNLVDQQGKIYQNSNKIPISLALYTVQNPPKYLEQNTLGNKMLKGQTEQYLINGSCTFQKIQIKQVTSHYKKGMLFLVVFAKMPSIGTNSEGNFIDYKQINPLIIEKVVVKAKKMKDEKSIKKEKKIKKNKKKRSEKNSSEQSDEEYLQKQIDQEQQDDKQS